MTFLLEKLSSTPNDLLLLKFTKIFNLTSTSQPYAPKISQNKLNKEEDYPLKLLPKLPTCYSQKHVQISWRRL